MQNVTALDSTNQKWKKNEMKKKNTKWNYWEKKTLEKKWCAGFQGKIDDSAK